MNRKDLGALREEAAKAIERGKLDKGLELYTELESREPASPAWPKRIGETHRRAGNNPAAIAAFERAVDKYVKTGFLVQAIAVCKLILQIDPAHSTTISRLSELVAPSAARPASSAGPEMTHAPAPALPAVAPAPAVPPPASPAAAPAPPVAAPLPVPARVVPPVRAKTAPDIQHAPPPPAARTPPARAPSTPGIPTPPPPPRTPPVRAQTAGGAAAHPPAAPARPPAPVPRVSAPVAIPSPRRPPVTLPPGGGLDALDLSTIVPGAKRLTNPDGLFSGINVLPLEELSFDDLAFVEEPDELPVDEPGDEFEFQVDDGLDPASQHRVAAAVRTALISTPLFAGLPPGVLEQLITRMSLVVLDPEEVLFREGDPGACLYVISEGEVAVESSGGVLAQLGPGAFFGEVALVTDVPRSATIRAVTRVELLAIDRDVVRDAASEEPEIINVLLRFVRDRLIDRMTRTSELFRPFADPERVALAVRFELVEVAEGVQLIVQGARADGLYVVVAGRVDVWHDGDPDPIAVLGSGDVFGEMSLLGGGGSTANCRAASRVLALRMPAHTFREVIMTHPHVLAYLAELEEKRAPRVLNDEFVDLRLDML